MDENLEDITAQNRRAWNEIAQVRSKIFPPAGYFAAGKITLASHEVAAAREVFGEIAELRVIHLQCATGEDTLSWSVLGARADGVDISDRQIHIAQEKAAAAGLGTRFHAADVYTLPTALPPGWLGNGYDLVFTGGGAVVWLPNLPAWAKTIAALLRPGGWLLLSDEHPLTTCLVNQDGQLKVIDDYFRRTNPYEGTDWAHFSGGEFARENKYEFTWPLGDIVTALARSGLVVEKLEELPGGPEWKFGSEQGEIARLPGSYLILARKS